MEREQQPLTPEMLEKINAYWRAANYLSVGQLYLLDNPLLKEPLKREHIKKKIVGHWGTVPGQNFIYAHLNRIINKYNLNMFYISGPGHGGNALVANTYLEGSYSEIYPNVSEDIEGMKKLFKQFSFPCGISSHVAPETPGSIHEGGELGYSLAHAFGAVLDNPDLIVACVIGDGEAETGPLATSWHSHKFLNPITDGAVLPILHLNGYKISNPTVLSRISNRELQSLLEGYGWKPYFVEGKEPMNMHQKMATVMDQIVTDIKKIQKMAREEGKDEKIIWPMIVFRSPKGWTGPKYVGEKQIEGTFRAHQVPITMTEEQHVQYLETWMKSYKPEELFDEEGKLFEELKALAPKGNHRMGMNPNTNGGLLRKELRLPDYRHYGVELQSPGAREIQDMNELGRFVRDIFKLNEEQKNFRIFGPDETMSNRLTKVFEEVNRSWNIEKYENDEYLATDGRVMDSMLSEHLCQGWLEGYLLTGRHGFFASYEAFVRVVDSMFTQHAKWLKMTTDIPWRADIASLNYILTSNVWQQDHNGYTHQDPGFIDHVIAKKGDIIRVYLPPDANCLLTVFNHCIQTKNKINVIIASKHPRPQWLSVSKATIHCAQGIGIWDWASNDFGEEPDIVLVGCGETPTLECLAAITIMREYLPNIKIRFINVVDLMTLATPANHPHGLGEEQFDTLFTKDKPIIFAFHGYPRVITEFFYHRKNHNLKVRGYQEEGAITTPFDMRVLNEIDRFHLVIDMVETLPELDNTGAHIIQFMRNKLVEHKQYIAMYGEDMEEIKSWKWQD